jgi:HK97 family phage major capsid protein
MLLKAHEYEAQIQTLVAEAQAIEAQAQTENREMSEDEEARFFAIWGTTDKAGEITKLEAKMENAKNIEAQAKRLARKSAIHNQLEANKITVPAMAKRHGNLKCYKNEEDAYLFGRWLQATVCQDDMAREYCERHGVEFRAAMSEGSANKGGFLVPEPTEATIIRYVEQYGVIRANARNYPMSSDTANLPRREGGLTVYFPGEGGTITDSDVSLGNIQLVAKKMATLTKVSTELSEDAVISVADMLTLEIGQAFALKEDQMGFLGDGSSTYGGVTGLANALAAGSTIDAASGNVSFATFDLLDFEKCVGQLPLYADNSNTCWYISKKGYALSMLRLMDAAGGNTNVTLNDGVRSMPMFLGYPVCFSQAMPSTDAVSTYQAYLGDLSQAVTFGSRRGVTISADPSVYFASDQIGIKGTQRIAINVHERGDASTAGSIIGLKTAAS